jgi:DNA modification methylase
MPADDKNLLAYGDNLDVLRRYVRSESVDLVYLDPPFNSNADYNLLYGYQDGRRAAAQIKAFKDTWRWDRAAVRSYEQIVEGGGQLSKTMQAFRMMLGPSNLLAYLAMMAPRLVALHDTMKPTASIFLHCDPSAGSHLKLLMDAVFGADNFRNEVVWAYSNSGRPRDRYAQKHDILLVYGRAASTYFNAKAARVPYSQAYIDSHFRDVDEQGRKVRRRFDAGKWRVYYPDEGMIPNDVWTDIPSLNSVARERLGYPTQKPVALLDRIIAGSCPPGGVVLDPFCGCGTAIVAAQRTGRRWIGIDITHHATALIKNRLIDEYGPALAADIRIIGEPTTVEDARILAADDPFQFQAWALGLVGARPLNGVKHGADRGIDGGLFFHESEGGITRQILISVKAGNTGPSHVRDLRGVVEREQAAIGVLISLAGPTAAMRSEAAEAGYYDLKGHRYPRLQLRTVADLLDGRGIEYPPTAETLFRPTIWPPEAVPTAPKKPKARRRKVAADQATWTTPGPEPRAADPSAAQRRREEYARREADRKSERVSEPSPEAPRSPRTSRRDQ